MSSLVRGPAPQVRRPVGPPRDLWGGRSGDWGGGGSGVWRKRSGRDGGSLVAGRTGYPLRRSRLPLPGVSPSRPQLQRAANRDWIRSRKDAGPCGGTSAGERSPVLRCSSSPPTGSEELRGGGSAVTVKPGPFGAAVILV